MVKKVVIQEEYKIIEDALARFPEGALIEEIQMLLPNLNRRTLQRRLAKLYQEDHIAISGISRATRYHLKSIQKADNPQTILEKEQYLIPLSESGKEILALVTRPLQQRRPVGYQQQFLESYLPNKSYYLRQSEIQKLTEIGKTTMPDKPAGTYIKEVLNRLLIDLSWNSSRLEGNTYSLLDTQRLINLGETAEGKSLQDAQMILNHKDAIEFLAQSAEEIGFNRTTLLNLHAFLANNLLPDPSSPGRLRSYSVGIPHSVYEPLSVPHIISELFDLILAKANAIENPFEQAFFAMVHLPYLQAFEDVNKRVSRLAVNIPLIRHNLSPLSFVDVPETLYISGIMGICELNRIELLKDVFLWAYERSAVRYAAICQSIGQPNPIRLKYREMIRYLITSIVTEIIAPRYASAFITEEAKLIPEKDQAQLIEAVETELLALHEGNIARYHIRPEQFKLWQEHWNQPS